VNAIAKENLSWITYTRNKWILDLDKFKEFIALKIGADTLIHIPWEWFKGKVSIEPEYETEERSDFGKSRYKTRFDFYIVNEVSEKETVKKSEVVNYVDEERIKELASLPKDKFDTTKLVELCKELNQNYKWNNYFAVGALLRTILHHVPPVFGMKEFKHVASDYSWGKSHKNRIMKLSESAKDIADNILHEHIRKLEVLPKKPRVDFKAELDILLAEIVTILKT